eukprot:1150868-Pelagomonas_calceolata.AAC.6
MGVVMPPSLALGIALGHMLALSCSGEERGMTSVIRISFPVLGVCSPTLPSVTLKRMLALLGVCVCPSCVVLPWSACLHCPVVKRGKDKRVIGKHCRVCASFTCGGFPMSSAGPCRDGPHLTAIRVVLHSQPCSE